jgi:hypothetical protein
MLNLEKRILIIFNLIFRSIVKHILMLLLFGSSQMDAATFNIAVIPDMQRHAGLNNYDSSECISDVCKAIGTGVYEIVPDDLEGLLNSNWTIQKYMYQFHPCYVLVGDHEAKNLYNNSTWFCEYSIKEGNSYNPIVNTGLNQCGERIYSFRRDYFPGCRIEEINNRV